jgi:zinc-ribbon domain
MASWCPNCGRNVDEGEKFCRQCGMPQHLGGQEATTWILSPQPAPESSRGTTPVQPGTTSPTMPPTGAVYIPPTPAPYYPPPYPTQYQAPTQTGQPHISLGDWLSGGWQVYKENWALMSVATLLGFLLSAVTVGILAGPLLMGMFRMAFKTMRGERPEIGDLFRWDGRFIQAFLTGLIFAAVHFALGGLGNNSPFFSLLSVAATPLLSVMLGFTMSLIIERGLDVAQAINQVAKLVFSRDAFMWWVVGLVLAAITGGGLIACGIGVLVTVPWMISASAVAYKDVYGIDDPNRTLH